MTIVWDDRLKKNILGLGSALNPRWGRALSAGVDLFENLFLESGSESRMPGSSSCAKKWFQRFRRNPDGIHLIIGKQRAGKTALCFFLAQAARRKPIYAITASSAILPDVRVIEDILQVPKGGVCVIDDAQLFFNSMRTAGDDYMILRNLSNIVEKSDICLIFNAHSTTLLNKTPIESTKTLIFKELGFFGADTERGYVKPYAEIAEAFFQRLRVPERIKYMVLFDLPYKCIGAAKTPLPKGWSQKISTSCDIIDAEYSELSKKEDKINDKVNRNPGEESFEDFTE